MVNQEQIFFDFRLNFNLLNSDTKKATTIYAVVYYKRNSIELILGLRYIPVSGTRKDS